MLVTVKVFDSASTNDIVPSGAACEWILASPYSWFSIHVISIKCWFNEENINTHLYMQVVIDRHDRRPEWRREESVL